MWLYIVRHGPAEARDPRRWADDERRPLSREGVEKTRRAARGFARLVVARPKILSSPASRARRTAELFAEELEPAPPVELWHELLPGQFPEPILERLARLGAAPTSSIAVVGHQPTLAALLGLAVTGEAVPIGQFGKAGVAAVRFPRRVRAGAGSLEWLLTRKQLAAAAR